MQNAQFTPAELEEVKRLKTVEEILEFRPNCDGNRVSASRLGPVLMMLDEKIEFPRTSVTTEDLQEAARQAQVNIFPSFVSQNITATSPNWLSDSDTDLESDFVADLQTQKQDSRILSDKPQLIHQARFVMSEITGQNIRHAGLAVLRNQHRAPEERSMLYFEPLRTRRVVPDVVKQWAADEGVADIILFNGTQRPGNMQCVRNTIQFYVRWLLTNQNLEVRGETGLFRKGVWMQAPVRHHEVRTLPPMARKYWDEYIIAANNKDASFAPVIKLGN